MAAGRRPWRLAVVLMVMAGLAGVRARSGAMRDGFQGPEGGRRVVRLHADKTTGGVDATELLFAGVKKGALQALNVTERNVDLSALPTAANIQVGAAANVVQKHPAVKHAVESIADLPLYKVRRLVSWFACARTWYRRLTRTLPLPSSHER